MPSLSCNLVIDGPCVPDTLDRGYIAVTSECPKGFKGVVYVGRGTKPGGGLDQIIEQAFPSDQIRKMKPVPKDQVPSAWLSGRGYEKPAPKPAPKPRPVEVVEEEPVFDADGELIDLMPVRRVVYQAQNLSGEWAYLVGVIIGAALVFWRILS